MKNIIKSILIICLSVAFWSCTNEDIVVHYPASTPKIDTAKVVENRITYGDSIHVRLSVSDKVEPLSTLQLKVVCNNEIVASETFRTKGNSSNIAKVYAVPFVANRPDSIPVKVYLTLTNVEGHTKDSIISTTIARRPAGLTQFYLVPDFGTGTSAQLLLIDPINQIYKATGMQYANSLSYKIATKIDRFKRIDWTGKVFGLLPSGVIGLIDPTGASISSSDGTLVGISEFTFDAIKFTTKVGGKLLEPVTTLDVTADLPASPTTLTENTNFRGGNVYFGEGVEVSFTGITGTLANSISPDYFQVTGTNKAKFLGKTGLYKAYFLTTAGYLYIEPQPEAIYPDAIWVCGAGFGRPQQSPYPTLTTTPWNWNSPLEYAPCRLVSTGVYQVTLYLKNIATTDAITGAVNVLGSCNFKFFNKRGWWDGHEQLSTSYTVSTPLFQCASAGNVGNTVGHSDTPFEGIYQITLNQNDNTMKVVKLN